MHHAVLQKKGSYRTEIYKHVSDNTIPSNNDYKKIKYHSAVVIFNMCKFDIIDKINVINGSKQTTIHFLSDKLKHTTKMWKSKANSTEFIY